MKSVIVVREGLQRGPIAVRSGVRRSVVMASRGLRGLQGEEGVSVTAAAVDPNGHLIITYSDVSQIDAGLVVGPQGDEGEAGIGVASMAVNGSGHLIVTYSDAQQADLGSVIGPEGPGGAAGSPGAGVPAGGSAGQVLTKASSTDLDTQWATPAAGGGGGGAGGDLVAKLGSAYFGLGYGAYHAATSMALVASTALLVPFMVSVPMAVNSLSWIVTTGVTSAISVGIYQNVSDASGDTPGAALWQIDVANSAGVTGQKTKAVDPPLVLQPGVIYWYAVACDGAPSVRAVGSAGVGFSMGMFISGTTMTPYTHLRAPVTGNVLPASFVGATFTPNTGTRPVLMVRMT